MNFIYSNIILYKKTMKNFTVLLFMILCGTGASAFAQTVDADRAAMEKGVNLITTKTYSAEDDARILSLYKNLRVADVSDGMDMVGLPGTGLVDPSTACPGRRIFKMARKFLLQLFIGSFFESNKDRFGDYN